MELSYITERSWQPAPTAPARPFGPATSSALLTRVLDEIDYGMLVVTVGGALRYANQLARHELQGHGPLGLAQGQVRAHQPGDQNQLQLALADAVRGRRRLITLGLNGSSISIAVLPMPGDDEDDHGEALALLTFGKRQASETLTIDFFARSQGLTGAEGRVLQALCHGAKPKEIASQCDVAISTVRSHICSIRVKTQTANIRELVDRVAKLPPMTPAVKTVRTH